MIVDDARVSRFICNVAERLGLSCQAISKNSDIEEAHKKTDPDIIFLGINPQGPIREKVMQQLAVQYTDSAIILVGMEPNQISDLESMGKSLGLDMAGALPDIFDTDMLKRKLGSLFPNLCTESGIRGGNGESVT